MNSLKLKSHGIALTHRGKAVIPESCSSCVQRVVLSPRESGRLLSRHFGLMPVASLTRSQIAGKPGDPDGWLDHVEKSVLSTRSFRDPIGVIVSSKGQEIRDGNHRAWLAYRHRIFLPALIFTPSCGVCTEETFGDSLTAWTQEIGWWHHQQGFPEE